MIKSNTLTPLIPDNSREDEQEKVCKSCDDQPYVQYTNCRDLHPDYQKITKWKARNYFTSRGGTGGRETDSKFGGCAAIGNPRHETFTNRVTNHYMGSWTSCKCCDESKFSGPELITKYLLLVN